MQRGQFRARNSGMGLPVHESVRIKASQTLKQKLNIAFKREAILCAFISLIADILNELFDKLRIWNHGYMFPIFLICLN